MAGIPVGGIISIPNNHEFRANTSGKGAFLNFKTYYSDIDYKGEKFFHCYKISMWVPIEEVDKYEDMIRPGKYFRFTGFLEARVRENTEYDPIMNIKVDRLNWMPLKIGSIES